ncbi:MAG: cytochrome C oxidase subunit IV family protein [Bacteroidetes bacterium]|nr:cytochrome C oxidase subunit IV family protein [Bacteroidota bacterium]
MERDDLIEYSLPKKGNVGLHDENEGSKIRKKIYKVTILLTVVTVLEVFLGAVIKQDAAIWPLVKWSFVVLTLLKAGYIVIVFMHLGDERPWLRYVVLVPYFIFVLYLIFIALWEAVAIKGVLSYFS